MGKKDFWKGFGTAAALTAAVCIAWKPVCRVIPWESLPFGVEMPRSAKISMVEDYLERFQGAVVSVSHDRYFLDKACGRIFAFVGNGKIRQYEGGYSDMKAAREREIPQEPEGKQPVPKKEPPKEDRKDNAAPLKKMSYKDQREYDGIGAEIAALEEKIAAAEGDMVECMTDYVRLQEISAEKEKLEAALEERMERWMELSELAEEIERNKR